MTAIYSQPLNPQVVYVQATTPSDLTEGKLWYNTTADTLYVSDGSSYAIMTTDLSPIQKQLLEMDLNILINSTASSSTLNDWESMFIDIFTDADGTNNTIDTGNTTAVFRTGNNSYSNITSVDTNETSGITFNTTASISDYYGFHIHANSNLVLTEIKKHASCTATKGYLTDDDGNILKSASFIGDYAFIFYPLISGTNYYIGAGSDGSDYDVHYDSGALGYPINNTNINFLSGSNNLGSEHATLGSNIIQVSTTTTVENTLIQTNVTTVKTGATHTQLFSHNTITGTGTITYDISMDNGATYTTNLTLNTKNAITSTTGTQMIIKLNLNGIGVDNIVKAKDYSIMLFY